MVKYRNELKNVITSLDALVIKSRLSSLLHPDPNAGPDGMYHIRSLYFDTPEDKALWEKISGVPVREKFRIRFYNHDHSFIRLEKKMKYYGKVAKLGARLTKEEVQSIILGDISFLKEADQAICREFYMKFKTERFVPKTIVDYQREAFFYPVGNVRITIDSDVRASSSIFDLFDPGLTSVPVITPGMCILEIKFDELLPEFVQDIIQLDKSTTTAVSKYTSCRLI